MTKQDIVAFQNKLATQVAARTANHDLKALKMLFKDARRDGVVTDDPAEFVDTIRQRAVATRRTFKIEEVRAILNLADEEWRSMILFGLYTGQRLGDIASLRWNNVDCKSCVLGNSLSALALLRNQNPATGERLTALMNMSRQEDGETVSNRQVGYGLVFGVPKSLSIYLARVLWSQQPYSILLKHINRLREVRVRISHSIDISRHLHAGDLL